MDSILIVPALLLPFILFRWFRRVRNPLLSLPLPPGPRGYPIVGNLFDVPKKMPWKVFHEWSKSYGDMFYLDIPKQPTIVLDSAEAAIELLEKRSDIYSDRTQYVMDELMFHRWNFVIMPYSPEWRAHRRLFHQYFNQRQSMEYRPLQIRGARAFLQRALDNRMSLVENIKLLYASVVLKVVYDMDIDTMDNEYVHLAHDALDTAAIIRVPGAFWVEFFPFLKYLPDWVPGTGRFKGYARRGSQLWKRMHHEPYDTIKQNLLDGKAGNSVLSGMLETLQKTTDEQAAREQEAVIRNVIGITYGGAFDTTTTAAQSFVIAMSLFPEVQRKAQAEIDRVVGPNRLVDFSDFDDLVYCQAIVLESIRWNVVLPVGVPHQVIRDDEFKGYRIPKGTTIIPNLWAMLRNPDDFPEPDKFMPERYLTNDGRSMNPNVRDPSTISFGFGRRICPGRWFANAALFISVTSILQTMDIEPILGEDGKAYNPLDVEIDGILMSSATVPCTLTPRSKGAEHLIRDWEDENR